MTLAHVFHPTILREYDIRGIVNETLHAADAYAIGRAFGTMCAKAGGRHVAVGRDGRLSSPEMADAVILGLRAASIDVIDIGLGPTPMLYFAAKTLNADGGIMITGSHNPPNHNGFKMVMKGKPFFGADIQELGQIARSGASANGSGGLSRRDLGKAYADRLLQDYNGQRPLRVVWDCGNGASGEIVRQLVAKLPGHHKVLFAEIDGNFPNHHPDPTDPHTLVALKAEVADERADLGIAFDGDGDRIGVVDGQGRILWGDQILVLLAEDVLKMRPGATIMADVKASQSLFDAISAMGGEPLMWKTGHSLIKTKMAEIGCPLAGEMSGHIFFADSYYGYDDALYAAVRFLSKVARMAESLAAWYDRLPKLVNTPEIRIDCPDERKFAVIEEVRSRLADAGAEVNATDGVRVKEGGGWWLLRASNTQAVLVARAEAADEAGLAALKTRLTEQLAASGLSFPA
ncbi:MAG: phosphomannomutase/phosphoglucomutase [Alphaproteobacteria bacterium]|nr:phosphomannomutase/phosphoglucomutase [Alphaproteobacteria bacterium]